MNILLINPFNFTNYPQPPMGLALLAAVLEEKGFQVNIIDANAQKIEPEKISSFVKGANAAGITAMTPTIAEAINIAQHIKKSHPDLPVILGGPHATLLPEETLNEVPQIDIVVKGEGEETFIKLLHALKGKEPLDEISGICFRKNGIAVNNPPGPSQAELDTLPFLAYHLLPMGKYKPHPPHGRSLPFAALITSRGCPYKCSYCSKPVFGYKFRAQSPERVVEEISYYQKRFGIREIAFYDDVFTLNKKRAYAIAEEILKRNLKIHWTCETRVDLIDKELLQHIKASGCYSISYGIESASQKILQVINKNTTIEQAEEATYLTRAVGLQTVGYFMIGCPEESTETIKNTIELAKRLKLDYAQFSIATPLPGTEFYKLYKYQNKSPISWDKFIYDGILGKESPVFESLSLSRHDLQQWRVKAYKEFYLRPSYIWQKIIKLTSLNDFKLNFRGLCFLLEYIKG